MSDCTQKHGFKYKTKCYRAFTDGMPTHDESADKCKNWNSTATLFMPDSAGEIDFIDEYIRGTGRAVWVDAVDRETEGTLFWKDSKCLVYRHL